MKKNSNIAGLAVGIVFILIGVSIAARLLFHISIFFKGWWTLFIIIPNLIGMCNNAPARRKKNIIGLCIGIFFLLVSRNIISGWIFNPLFIGAALMYAGYRMITGKKIRYYDGEHDKYRSM